MKTLYLSLLLFFSTTGITLQAQFVTIPDSAFRGWMINHGLAACLTGNQLDTTCSSVAALTYMDCSNKQILDLTGIEFFRNLDTLICNNNSIDTLPVLPEHLDYLNCATNNYLYAFTLPLPTGLKYLDCSNNQLGVLPVLPDSISTLICINDALTSITNFPAMLIGLNCSNNSLASLPVFPSGLTYLDCSTNSLQQIPPLPSLLDQLYCKYNNLTSLPMLPSSLTILECSNNPLLNVLPTLPNALNQLICKENGLTSLPPLPLSMKILQCDANPSLHTLPVLPDSITILYCTSDSLASLPVLPTQLIRLDCSNNNLTSVPALPSQLMSLRCSYNQLTNLPNMPDGLYELICNNNSIMDFNGNFSQITSYNFYLDCSYNNLFAIWTPSTMVFGELDCSHNYISSLSQISFNPITLGYMNCSYNQLSDLYYINFCSNLDCSHNQITSIQNQYLSQYMQFLNCSYNQISTIDDLPISLIQLNISHNLLECLPNKPPGLNSLSFAWTNIHCIPDYSYSSLTGNLPICQPYNNCPSKWNIIGTVFFDLNGNCSVDASDKYLKNIPVVLDSAGVQLQRFLTDEYGRYSFRTGFGTYTVRLDTANVDFQVVCPGSFFYSTTLSAADSTDSLAGFAIQCNNGFDLAANSISPLGIFRPGGTQTLYLNAGDAFGFSTIHCNSSVAGTVQAFLSGPVTYLAPAPGAIPPTIVSGNTITWAVPDFSQVNPGLDFNIQVEVSTTASAQDSVCVQLDILPLAGDNFPPNNSKSACFPIRNSFDPNEKYMVPSGLVDTTAHWFNFTIYFQNTGTAPAEMIFILDTLDVNLDASTFTFLQSSHNVITQILPGNILRFNYANIQLMDSTTNEAGSHGFIQFKVKRLDNLPFGTTFSNTAYIHFDYNPAVATNTVSATLDNVLSVGEDISKEFKLYPNPAHDVITITHTTSHLQEQCTCTVFSLIGNPIKSFSFPDKPSTNLNIADLKSGIYFLKFEVNQKSMVRKVVVE
ncbi:MAG TPA: T9SS type A sorting domain-containing protein [Bacteroidia bacterium]|nr:T9SS type A sorting domain-containing protein [Bacteroidia bacterium]